MPIVNDPNQSGAAAANPAGTAPKQAAMNASQKVAGSDWNKLVSGISTAYDASVKGGRSEEEAAKAWSSNLASNSDLDAAAKERLQKAYDEALASRKKKALAEGATEALPDGSGDKRAATLQSENEDKKANLGEFSSSVIGELDDNTKTTMAAYKDQLKAIKERQGQIKDAFESIKSQIQGYYDQGIELAKSQQASEEASAQNRAGAMGVSSAALANTVGQIINDPARKQALENLKANYIKAIQDSQQAYNSLISAAEKDELTLTDAQAKALEGLRAKREELKKMAYDVQDAHLTDLYKPTKEYLDKLVGTVTDSEQAQAKNQQDIVRYGKSTPEERKAMLTDKLYNYGVNLDRARLTAEQLAKAAAMPSLADAIQFLSTAAADATDAAQLKLIREQLGKSSGSGSSGSAAPAASGSSATSAKGVSEADYAKFSAAIKGAKTAQEAKDIAKKYGVSQDQFKQAVREAASAKKVSPDVAAPAAPAAPAASQEAKPAERYVDVPEAKNIKQLWEAAVAAKPANAAYGKISEIAQSLHSVGALNPRQQSELNEAYTLLKKSDPDMASKALALLQEAKKNRPSISAR